MKIQVDPKILNLVYSIEPDLNKAIKEALNLWLKEKIIICPYTHQYCKNNNIPCNDCSICKE